MAHIAFDSEGEHTIWHLGLGEPLLRMNVVDLPGRRFTIGHGLETTPAKEYIVTLRRQLRRVEPRAWEDAPPELIPSVGSVWAHTYCVTDDSASSSVVSGELGGTLLGSVQAVYGLLPTGVVSVEAEIAGSGSTPVQTGDGVYLTSVPVGQHITMIFRDAVGGEVRRISTSGMHP